MTCAENSKVSPYQFIRIIAVEPNTSGFALVSYVNNPRTCGHRYRRVGVADFMLMDGSHVHAAFNAKHGIGLCCLVHLSGVIEQPIRNGTIFFVVTDVCMCWPLRQKRRPPFDLAARGWYAPAIVTKRFFGRSNNRHPL